MDLLEATQLVTGMQQPDQSRLKWGESQDSNVRSEVVCLSLGMSDHRERPREGKGTTP